MTEEGSSWLVLCKGLFCLDTFLQRVVILSMGFVSGSLRLGKILMGFRVAGLRV